ncbi:signal recognition particle subunit SRP72, partial [Lecanoromycetidae sp. Uapishka_2]
MSTPAKTLASLLQRPTIDDHEEVLRACNASLKASKNDLDTQHIKFVALLKLDRDEDALRVLEESGDRLKQRVGIERAYALYKIGELEEAKDTAKVIADDRGARHVEAQASYRSEDFVNAAALYKDLAGEHATLEGEENDVRINSGATDAQLEWTRQGDLVVKKKAGREDLEAFETAYNAAYLCNALDELTDQEKTAELLPISVQQLYVLSKLGKNEEAEKLASDISVEDISDLSTKQIAQNNKLASGSTASNPYLAHRVFHSTEKLPKTDNLFRLQAEKMQQNGLALDLLASKSKAVIKATNRILSEASPTISPHINNISVLNAAAHAQSQLAKMGLKEILPLLEKRPGDIGLVMTVIQLYVLTNNHGSAVTVLESLIKHLSDCAIPADQDVLYAPGLVALQVSLYSSQGRKSQIKTVLAKAASYWRHKSKPPTSLLQAAGSSLLDSPDPQHQSIARNIFDTLHQQDPSSKYATAGYVAAHALTSPEKVAAEADTLTPVQRLIAGIDITALEEAGVPSLPSTIAITNRKRPLDEKPKPTKKRFRKSKLPKDYDPSKPPDPERWLPLRDRSTYKPKGKKGKRKAEEKTQGGVVVEKAEGKPVGGEGVIKPAAKPGGGQGKPKKKGKR